MHSAKPRPRSLHTSCPFRLPDVHSSTLNGHGDQFECYQMHEFLLSIFIMGNLCVFVTSLAHNLLNPIAVMYQHVSGRLIKGFWATFVRVNQFNTNQARSRVTRTSPPLRSGPNGSWGGIARRVRPLADRRKDARLAGHLKPPRSRGLAGPAVHSQHRAPTVSRHPVSHDDHLRGNAVDHAGLAEGRIPQH